MKKLLKSLLVVSALGMLTLTSCKKNDVPVTATSGKAGALTVSNTSITLSKTDTTNNPILTFTITPANYGYKGAVVTNTIQIDTVGDNWAHPVLTITLATNATTQSYTTAQLNSMALGQFKIAAGKTGNFNVRLEQTIGTTVAPIYSAVVPISITPYSIAIPITYVYVVGAYQGWSLNARDTLASPYGKIYSGIINFPAGGSQFLILPDANDYNNKYATNDSSTPSVTVTVGANNNLVAPAAAGSYLVTLNLTTNTISFELVNVTFSAIGDALQGWSTDVPLTYSNTTQSWVVKTAFVSTGSFKVRQDDAWTTSWGTIATPDGTSLTSANGGNIPVPVSGTYLFSFKIAPSPLGTAAPTTATYTLTLAK
jgi:hypothetical protein